MEYKVISDAACLTAGHKRRKIETALNEHARDGWTFAALDPILLLGIDVGFYLVLQRTTNQQ